MQIPQTSRPDILREGLLLGALMAVMLVALYFAIHAYVDTHTALLRSLVR